MGNPAGDDPVVAAARAGDELAFGVLADRHRRELHVHCYRLLGSFEEAEDAVQETFLRAWRRRESLRGWPTFRAWLYRIATNACLDELRRGARRPAAPDTPVDASGSDPSTDPTAPRESQPDAVLVAKESVGLVFLAIIQLLSPRQRAVLIMRDVLGLSASQTAARLDLTAAAVNSALQRARAILRDRLPPGHDWKPAPPTDAERALLTRFLDAYEWVGLAALAAENPNVRA